MTSVEVGRFGSAVYPPGATLGPRTLADHQLVWILSGSAQWTCAGQTRELRPGQLLLVRPEMPDRWQWDLGQPTTHGYVYFRVPTSRSAADLDMLPVIRVTGPDDPLPVTLRYLLRLDVTSPDDLTIARELVRFVLVLFGRRPAEHTEPALPASVQCVVEHVYRAWAPSGVARPLRLDELAAAATMSTGHLCRVFRERFGVGPVTAFELLR